MKPQQRWFIDFDKFRTYLQNQYSPSFVKYYDTVDTQPRTNSFKNKAQAKSRFHAKLTKVGYDVVAKPLKYIRQNDGSFKTKGNMDIELAIDMIKEADALDLIILISGDSDYTASIKLLHKQGKAIIIISFDKLLSWELRRFTENNSRCRYVCLDKIKTVIERL